MALPNELEEKRAMQGQEGESLVTLPDPEVVARHDPREDQEAQRQAAVPATPAQSVTPDPDAVARQELGIEHEIQRQAAAPATPAQQDVAWLKSEAERYGVGADQPAAIGEPTAAAPGLEELRQQNAAMQEKRDQLVGQIGGHVADVFGIEYEGLGEKGEMVFKAGNDITGDQAKALAGLMSEKGLAAETDAAGAIHVGMEPFKHHRGLLKQLQAGSGEIRKDAQEIIAGNQDKKVEGAVQPDAPAATSPGYALRTDFQDVPEAERALVTRAQKQLIALGANLNPEKKFARDGADGLIGEITAKEVVEFQKKHGLPADGVITEELVEKMEVAVAAKDHAAAKDRPVEGQQIAGVAAAPQPQPVLAANPELEPEPSKVAPAYGLSQATQAALKADREEKPPVEVAHAPFGLSEGTLRAIREAANKSSDHIKQDVSQGTGVIGGPDMAQSLPTKQQSGPESYIA